MTEVVSSSELNDASMDQTTNQAPITKQPSASVSAVEHEDMNPEVAPTVNVFDESMDDAPAEPDGDGDSEAETLIQSPEKQRIIADNISAVGSASATRPKDEDSTVEVAAIENDTNLRKRKRSVDDELTSGSSRRSSPLSSPRSSSRAPPHWLEIDSDASISKHIGTNPSWRPRGSDGAESDNPESKPVRNTTRKRRPSDILPPISKHRTKNNSGGVDPGSTERRETRSATYPRHNSEDRSPSPRPQRREHRRGVSTQLTLGDVERRKRGRPPAIHTRRSRSIVLDRAQSESSEESDSPEQNQASHKFSSLDHDTMSPAKITTGPRKWRDKNGRTFLSRAASNNDLAASRAKFAERPEDLNVPDNAGNTPLQIASLQGYVTIVKFLLENGCDVNTRNIDRDTALIDAVENGHVEVVRLLLDHGANPRLGNAKGDEPYELVPQDDENYHEIRKLLADAKETSTTRRLSVEPADTSRDGASSRAASAASPRDSPPMTGPRSPPAGLGRRRTGRSESTRNDLLWQANTQENLKKLASQGDVQGVANILNVLQKAETESLIAAAKAGHEEVLQYLLAMGDTEPDPDPIRHLKIGYNTPLLAAIGRGHPEVVKLLVEQSGFNPMKKLLKGKAYFEISAERRGEQWQKEYEILKTAYDKYALKHRKATSPRSTRDSDKVKARTTRRSQSPISSKLRNSSSPTLTHKQLPVKSPRSLQKDKDRDSGSADGSEQHKRRAPKRNLADSSIAVASDQDQTVSAARKGHSKRRSQSDFSQQSNLDSEIIHRRRRLVTGKEHRRRKSTVDGSTDEDMVSVKAEGKASTVLKRARESVSPLPGTPDEIEISRGAAKKRRTVIESSPEETRPGLRKEINLSSSPVRERKALGEVSANEDNSMSSSAVGKGVPGAMELDDSAASIPAEVVEAPALALVDRDVPLQRTETTEAVKTEPVDSGPSEADLQLQKARQEEKARKAEEAQKVQIAKRLEEEKLALEKAAEEQRLIEQAERLRKEEEEAALRKQQEEERRVRLELEREERQRRHEEQLREQRRQEEQLREQQRREMHEAEQRRIDGLPALLKHCAILIDKNDSKARSEDWLKLFLPLFTVKSAQLDPTIPDPNKADLWLPSWQVAGFLATKDLSLRSYPALETRPATPHERQKFWEHGRNRLAYEFQTNQWNTSIKQASQREQSEYPKFIAIQELCWVKLSNFEDQIKLRPYLKSLHLPRMPCSLRSFRSQLNNTNEQSPQSTASFPGFGTPSKLTNGVSSHSSPFLNGNTNISEHARQTD